MIINTMVKGVPLVSKQSDMTECQRVFVENGIVDYINEEREFWIKIMGAETKGKAGNNRDLKQRALHELKHPD